MKKNHSTITAITGLTLIIIITIIIITTTSWNHTNNNVPTQTTTFHGIPVYTYSNTIKTYPHDASAFTQGLTFDDKGNLIEGTGLYGASSLRRVNLADGKILQQIDLDDEYFGEGITVVDNKIIQITWMNKIGFVYDKETFKLLNTFKLNTEGWGLTYNGKHIILSDGTSTLYFLDPNTYQTINSINVHDPEGPVTNLNELEYINGVIYANIWFSTKIAIINPTTGQIEAYLDLEKIAQPHTTKNTEAVLNGIAYNTQTNQLYVTGKYWSNLYEIENKKIPT
jgi:glutamine cyclotransferase